jgi:hypothetical protein
MPTFDKGIAGQPASQVVVPFGKYRGQPVEVLLQDTEYLQWLMAQQFLVTRYRAFYNHLVGYGAEAQDSPEHNQMQALFLEDSWCVALGGILRPEFLDLESPRKQAETSAGYQRFRDWCQLEESEAYIYSRKFENKGWDVTYSFSTASVNATRPAGMPGCTCVCDHADCSEESVCRNGKQSWGCMHQYHDSETLGGVHGRSRKNYPDHDYANHCSRDCYWSGIDKEILGWLNHESHRTYYPESASSYNELIYVELKPDLGDDYPAVLRQVTGYQCHGARCVVVRRHAFEHVTWDQVRKIYAASGVILISEDEIQVQ